MGLTKSDVNRIYYRSMIKEGYSHKEIIKTIPKKRKKQFKKDLNKTSFQSHFGF